VDRTQAGNVECSVGRTDCALSLTDHIRSSNGELLESTMPALSCSERIGDGVTITALAVPVFSPKSTACAPIVSVVASAGTGYMNW